MALPATAAFTGTNGTDVRTLSDWDGARSASAGGGACEIQSNRAQADAFDGANPYGGADWWTGDAFNANQYAQATVVAIASGIYVGVAVRCSGTDNSNNVSGYFFYSDSADGCYIDEYSGGSWIGTLAGPGTAFAVNDVIRLEISGSNLTAKVNGVTRLTATDTSLTSGRAGICAYDSGASAIDTWEGGDLGAVTTHPVAAWFRRRPAILIDSWRLAAQWADSTQLIFQRLRSAPHRIYSSLWRPRTPPRVSGYTPSA